jgi:hypothetical protein
LLGPQTQDIAWASRLQASYSLAVPLTGIGPTEIRLPNRPYFAPPLAGTTFHTFYGLRPTEPQPLSEVPIPDDGWVGLLELENNRVLEDSWERARELFKAATPERSGENLQPDFERLAEAEAALRVVRDLDREAYVPCLLLLHVALEKSQWLLAASHLRDAVRRHPAVFVEQPDLASYFGDPESLEVTARRNLRLGDASPTAETYALQAYCAWVLDDRPRLKGALDRLTAGDLVTRDIEELTAVRNALAAAANR